jgi:hypothetical protein
VNSYGRLKAQICVFLASAHRGEQSASHTDRFDQRVTFPTPVELESYWVQQPVRTLCGDKSLAFAENTTPNFGAHLVV